ncbi:hypothetical protein ACFL2Q_15645 [Thermodesulfobacteriota bacterium]
MTITIGALAALDLHLQSCSEKWEPNPKILNAVLQNAQVLWFWGESAFPYWFSAIKLLEKGGYESTSLSILKGLTRLLMRFNSHDNEKGLASPCFGAHELLENALGINLGAVDFRQFAGTSHVLEILVSMLARRREREFLEQHWQPISHIRLKRFSPERREDIFAWHTRDGLNQSRFFEAPQSWAKLYAESTSRDDVADNILEEFIGLHQFFILVVPHRATPDIVKALDQQIAPVS